MPVAVAVLKRFICLVCFFVLCLNAIASSTNATRPTVLVAIGAPGEEEFGKAFREWATAWKEACDKAEAKFVLIGDEAQSSGSDRERLQQGLETLPKEGNEALWLVLIGHGTFDGKEAKFNLRGPDVSASDLANWLKPFQRPLAIINTTSASAPFLHKLSATNRVVITATRSGLENNFARFGGFLAKAIADLSADVDKDGQTSLLEAYLTASRQVQEFYKTEGRLATEHALLDDNGDGLGTPADWFRGIRAVKKPQEGASMDGFRAHQMHLVRSGAEQKLRAEARSKRDALELEIARLREKKSDMPEEEYYARLEVLMLDLARI